MLLPISVAFEQLFPEKLLSLDVLHWNLGEIVLGAAEVNIRVERSGFIKVKMFAQLRPHWIKISGLARHLKIINVDTNEKLLPTMQVQTFPVPDWVEAATQERPLAVLLPVQTGLRMTIQIADEPAHRITEAFP